MLMHIPQHHVALAAREAMWDLRMLDYAILHPTTQGSDRVRLVGGGTGSMPRVIGLTGDGCG
jgi:hypothetical protein